MSTPAASGTAGTPAFFAVRRVREGFEVRGSAQASFGYRLPALSGRRPDGIYAAWAWDGRRATVETCRLGFWPMYYVATEHEFCVSSSLLHVASMCSAPLDLDEDAIATYLRLGLYVGEDTPFRSIRTVPADCVLTWEAGHTRIDAVPAQAPQWQHLSRQEALDGYVELAQVAIARHPIDGGLTLPLSGGRDSRHLLFELCRSSRRPDVCVTMRFPPTRSDEDVRIAKMLCEMVKMPHITLQQEGSFLENALRKNMLTGFCTEEHTWAIPLIHHLNAMGGTVFDGLGADAMTRDICTTPRRLTLARRGAAHELAADMLEGHEVALNRWLTPAARVRFSLERACVHLEGVMRRYIDWPNPIGGFWLANRTRREIALYSFGMISGRARVMAPFLEEGLQSYLSGLPGEMLLDKRFHDDAIARGYGRWAEMPYGLPDYDARACRWGRVERHRWFARAALAVGVYLAQAKSQLVERRFVVPRLAYLLVDGNADRIWFDPEKVVLMTQLERWIRTRDPGVDPAWTHDLSASGAPFPRHAEAVATGPQASTDG